MSGGSTIPDCRREEKEFAEDDTANNDIGMGGRKERSHRGPIHRCVGMGGTRGGKKEHTAMVDILPPPVLTDMIHRRAYLPVICWYGRSDGWQDVA